MLATLPSMWLRPRKRLAAMGFFLSGSASGLLLHIFGNHVILKNPPVGRIALLINFIAPFLMTAGGLCRLLAAEGRPRQARAHVSWRKERIFTIAFILFSLSYAAVGNGVLACGAALAAILCLFYQGFFLFSDQPQKTATDISGPVLFSITAVTIGYALWIILQVWPGSGRQKIWITWGALLISADLLIWGVCLWLHPALICKRQLNPLRRKAALTAALDGLIPLLSLIGICVSGWTGAAAQSWVHRLSCGGGLSLCLGAWIKLSCLIDRPIIANGSDCCCAGACRPDASGLPTRPNPPV